MHGTFKHEDTLPKTGKSRAARAEELAQKQRDEAFQREFAAAKAKPVPTIGSQCRTIFC